MASLIDRLQNLVTDTYTIESELGGGGMSRVFLAEEVRLGRKVVIKVLPPEMAAGVNVDRFEREIKLAAQLQHPHIVPLLTAGSSDDLLYYIMPYIEGESLRTKLNREGELPLGEALRILRDVADALTSAHAHGVVHRDIKPDNVLLSQNHAVVTDFGVAKAVTDSTGGQSLTSIGIALGTPAYMSPEQAAASAHIDHRSDIYSLGALAYEMLCGQPPFAGPTPQSILSAHVTQTPDSCATHRSSVPPAFDALIMRCLEKLPADRWQSAEDLRGQFEAMTTPSGGLTPTGTQPVTVSSAETRLHLNRPGRIAALYGLSSVGVLVAAYALMMLFGLPDWVLPMAGVLLLIGLPIVMMTSHAERHRATTTITGAAQSGATPTPLQRRLTWRQSLAGGGLAFGALTVAAGGYMAMRALGIGPAGTLVSTGALVASDRLILAEFENRTSDSTLGETITQAMRIDLAQSPIISVLEPSQVAAVLSRMRSDPDVTVTPEVAREVAEREGIKAFITGDIAPVGEGFLFSAQIISTGTGEALASGRESADNAAGIIPAVDRLSAHLRERIGESLRSVRADAPLEDVTTSSLEALRLFALGRRATMRNDFERAIALLEGAIAADSQFAMAYRDLGMRYLNIGQGWRTDTLLTLGYQLRDRLSERERYLLVAAYEAIVNNDIQASVSAYETLLEKYPDDIVANNNVAIRYGALGQWADGERILARYIGTGQAAALHYRNLFTAQGNQGKYAEAAQTLDAYEEAFPGNSDIIVRRANLASARWEYDRAEEYVNALKEAERGSARWQSTVAYHLRVLATVRGQLSTADRLLRDAVRFDVERGVFDNLPEDTQNVTRDDRVNNRITRASLNHASWFGVGGDLAGRIERWVRESPFPAEDRPYAQAVRYAARIGEVELARSLLDEQKPIRDSIIAAEEDEEDRQGFLNFIRGVEVEIALAEGRPEEAIEYYREQRSDPDDNCILCSMWNLGNAHDAAGNADSAIAWFELHLATPAIGRRGFDDLEYPYILRRLGELYDERGERDKAADYYSRFVELWKDADLELQPTVQSARERLARLVGEANRGS